MLFILTFLSSFSAKLIGLCTLSGARRFGTPEFGVLCCCKTKEKVFCTHKRLE